MAPLPRVAGRGFRTTCLPAGKCHAARQSAAADVRQDRKRIWCPPISHWKAAIPDWSAWLADEVPPETNVLRRNTHTGRLVLRSEAAPLLRRVAPCGTTDFVRRLETLLARPLLPQEPARKPKDPSKTTRKDGNA